ncbi:hypothetical protein NP233_g8126 [Leucocoprinus birnbaumii]|uniref:Mediator complex subunit 10 n=1 Tax=Leucocoprinus birnbaumii TaxID=56174 RepID=A0AAD5VRE3_9AGAR|nr:hypothetical protein NP233_g8126 [Leucocoprinus birnbaumii]
MIPQSSAPVPDSPRSSQSPPPTGVQGDLELELLGLANALYNLGTTVINDSTKERDKPGGGKQVGLRVNNVVQHLETIDTMVQPLETMIPMQVLSDIDNARNPMQLTRERLERAATENQFMNGKIAAIESYRRHLDEALCQSFPELEQHFRGQEENVAAALDAVINGQQPLPPFCSSSLSPTASPFAITPPTRKKLIQALLDDLSAPGKSRLNAKDAAKALLAVKSLGRDPSGSEFLASPSNLSTLLSLSASHKDDSDASLEALRCIANALLLVESSRETFLKQPVNGGEFCLNALEKAAVPDQIFVLARILFLSTAFSASYIVTFVDSKFNGRTVVEIISAKLDILLISVQNSTKMAKEAMTDVLKFTYNITHHYPKAVQENPQSRAAVEDEKKVLGDFWSSKLDGLLPPLLRLFTSLPPTFPNPITAPLTHVIHALIGIPVSPSLKNVWFPPTNRSSTNSPKSSASQTPPGDNRSESRSGSPVPQAPSSTKSSTLDRALSVLAASRRSLSRSSSPQVLTHTDVLQRAWDLLEVSFNHFFADNVEPDDPKVRELAKKEISDNSLDDLLTPLVVLITRMCLADEASRTRVRQWLVPDELDRTFSLEQRPDMLGKCLRLLPSVYHPRLKDATGEMLYAMAGSDASNLTGLVGYGNVAGFLFNKGILSAPPPSSGSSGPDLTASLSDDINPITGTTHKPKADLPEMTEEEKEQEVEKLLWLFDRLEKTGAIPADQNPIRKAIQEGKATLGP